MKPQILKTIFKNDPYYLSDRIFFNLKKEKELQKYDLGISIYHKKARQRLRFLILAQILQALAKKGEVTRRRISLKNWLLREKKRSVIQAFDIENWLPEDCCLLVAFPYNATFRVYSDREEILFKKESLRNNRKVSSAVAYLKVELKNIESYLIGKYPKFWRVVD